MKTNEKMGEGEGEEAKRVAGTRVKVREGKVEKNKHRAKRAVRQKQSEQTRRHADEREQANESLVVHGKLDKVCTKQIMGPAAHNKAKPYIKPHARMSTHRHTDTQTHRHTHADTQTHRHTDTDTDTDTDTHTQTHTHTHTGTQTHTHTSQQHQGV